MVVIGDIEFAALYVTISNSDYTGLTLDGEMQFVMCHRHTAALIVDGLDTEMHQVSAVSTPNVIFWRNSQTDGLACSLYLGRATIFPFE